MFSTREKIDIFIDYATALKMMSDSKHVFRYNR